MRSLSLVAAAAALLIFNPASIAAQQTEAPASADVLSAETVRADLAYLHETLEEAHYDLYAHRDEAEYDRFRERLLAEIDEPMPAPDVHRLFQRYLAYGNVGHAKTDAPLGDFFSYYGSGGKILALDVRIDDGRVFLAEVAGVDGAVPAGTELLALEGEPIGSVLDSLAEYVSAERPYMAHAQIERGFPVFHWMAYGPVDSVEAQLRLSDGTQTTVMLPAMDAEQRRALWQAHPTPAPDTDFSTREMRLIGDGIAYLRPGPFFNIGTQSEGPAPSYEASTFRTFIDESFRMLIAEGVTDLIIDLRDNPGGDNSFSDPMVAWFADEPFRFASRFMLRASAPTKAWYTSTEMPEAGSLAAAMRWAEAAQPNGSRYAFELPVVDPRDGERFTGKVYVLVNRHSYSNATTTAALIQDYGFGTIVGEETADVPTTYASVLYFDLPETGVTITYPKSYIVRPNGDERMRGVVPDIALHRQPIGSAEDIVLDRTIEAVRAARD